MLIRVFHCYNKSCPYKFIAIFVTYGLNIPISPSGPIHWVHFVLPKLKFHYLDVEYLPPEETIMVDNTSEKLLLHLPLCLSNTRSHCPLFVFQVLISTNLSKLAKIIVQSFSVIRSRIVFNNSN